MMSFNPEQGAVGWNSRVRKFVVLPHNEAFFYPSLRYAVLPTLRRKNKNTPRLERRRPVT
jgi:hypothetical protein